MSDMDNIDIETKLKMMFAVGAPVSNGFMIELKTQADVELDERHRIIKYNKHGKGLQLSGITIRGSSDIETLKELMKFLAEKSENATSPMTDTALLKEFISSEGNYTTEKNLKKRYKLIKQHIYLAPEFDEETKIRMMFVSSTKLHANILEELRKTALVEVDEYQRITKYKAINGSLELKGEHQKCGLKPNKKWTKPETDKLEMFIAGKSKKTKVPLSIKSLSREFSEKNELSRTIQAVAFYIKTHFRPNILKLDQYDIETRMRMMFTLSVPVNKGFLKELRKTAVVKVDEYQKITNYESNDGILKLDIQRLPPCTIWSKEENEKLLNFIVQKSKQTKVPLSIISLSREFAEKNLLRTFASVKRHISKHLSPAISKPDSFDMETKIRIMFAMSVPVEEEFLNELRKEAIVKIDEKRRIIKYKANDRSLELEEDHSLSAKKKTVHAQKRRKNGVSDDSQIDEEIEGEKEEKEESFDEEDDDINADTAESGRLSKRRYSDDDISSDSDDPDDNASDSSESGNDSKKEEKKEKVKKRTNSTSKTLKSRKSRKRQVTETDDESEEEESEEEDDDSSAEKVNKSKNRKAEKITTKGRITYFSETSDEGSEEEYQENEESEASSNTRRSERISKKRYSDKDFSCHFYQNCDNVSLDSSENLEDSEKEKEAEKLVDMASDSSPKVQRNQNQKRKIMENSSDTTSSSSKSRKRGRDADVHNHTKTDKVASGTMQKDDREAVQDGPEEPPHPIEMPIKQESVSYKEVKLENEEYKPDLSFLCNTTQSNMQNLPRTAEKHSEYVEQSTGNTEEMTSGKEFMKSLGSLVHTIDSPILAKLQSQIEKAIKEIGEGDHKIPTDAIARTLKSGLFILNKNAAMKPPTREYTSLRDFISFLRTILSTFRSSSLNTFQLKLKENAKKLNDQDEYILLDIIGTVLETLFLLISL